MKNVFFLSASAVLLALAGCNKESYIEQINSASQIVMLDTPVIIAAPATQTFYLRKAGTDASLRLDLSYIIASNSGLPDGNVQAGDSVMIAMVYPNGTLDTSNGCIANYAYSSAMSGRTAGPALGYALALFNRHKPYTAGPWQNALDFNKLQPNFKRNVDGYAGCSFTDGASRKTVYCWVIFNCNEHRVIVKGYGYNTAAGKAGL